MPTLQTERLQIVPFTETLIEAAMSGTLEGALGARVPAAWPGPDLAAALPFFLAQMQADPDLADWMGLILHQGEVVGDIGFKGRPDEQGMVEIGYSLIPAARGQGFATEAVRAMTAWALQQPLVRRVTAETESTNQASMRVLERAGFQPTGEQENLVLWAYVG
ncbi:MAG TPA: GNAT family N-acetyltransferase [Symbiobacteriaceae bacterium]|nr:GNAT family N-acetyltransferase [Symbiobacteriaceae bacterium]